MKPSPSRSFAGSPILLILLVSATLQLGYGLLDHAPDLDEAFYLDLARGISRFGVPSPRPIERPFLAHPVLFYYLESIPFFIGEPPLLLARSLSSVLSLSTLWIFYRLVGRLWDRRRAIAATAVLAINPCFIYYSHSVYMEATVTFFAVLALAFWLRDTPSLPRRPIAAGLLAGMALLTKYLGVLYVAGLVAASLHGPERRSASRARLAFLASVALLALTWPLYGLLVSTPAFMTGVKFWLGPMPGIEAAHSWRVAGVARFLAYATGVLTPAFVTLAIVGACAALLEAWSESGPATGLQRHAVLLGSWTTGLFALFCLLTPRRDVKYLAIILPLLALFASWPLAGLMTWARSPGRKVLLVGTAVLLLSPATWMYDPGESAWRPNLVVFSILRDGRYVDLVKLGGLIRAQRRTGQRAMVEAKNSLVAYYGDLPTDGVWGMSWTAIDERLRRCDYYVACSDADYLTAAERAARDERLRLEFERLVTLESDGIVQTLYRRR